MQEMKRKALARVWAVVGLAVWFAGQCVGSAYAAGSIDQEYAGYEAEGVCPGSTGRCV